MEVVEVQPNSNNSLFEERQWNNLVEQIGANRCTPFIGAGASSHHLPTASTLAKALADEFSYPLLQGREDLIRVTQYMAVRHEDGDFPKLILGKFFDLERCLEAHELHWKKEGSLYQLYRARLLPDRDNVMQGPYGTLASLPVETYLTTNYDCLMSKALARQNKTPITDFCRWTTTLLAVNSSPYDKDWRPTKTAPVVYHLHGHTAKPESMVATEDDYTDFIVNLGKDLAYSPTGKHQKCALPLEVRRIMGSHTLLFVGYRVADTNLRVVLRTLRSSLQISEQKVHVAVQLRPESDSSHLSDVEQWLKYLQDYYQWSLRITVFWGDIDTFTAELSRRLHDRGLI